MRSKKEFRDYVINNEADYFNYDFGSKSFTARECQDNEAVFEEIFYNHPFNDYYILEHPSESGVFIVSFFNHGSEYSVELSDDYVYSFIEHNEINCHFTDSYLVS